MGVSGVVVTDVIAVLVVGGIGIVDDEVTVKVVEGVNDVLGVVAVVVVIMKVVLVRVLVLVLVLVLVRVRVRVVVVN